MAVDVVVVGSANLDVHLDVPAIPRPGQTVLASGRDTGPGGKGANQAIAASRSGAATAFVGAVGSDAAGDVLRAELTSAAVDLGVLRTAERATGTAYVVVDEAGENAIVVDAGANATLVGLTAEERAVVGRAAVVLCQLEVPLETVTAAAAAASGTVVVNAAPARRLPPELTDRTDVLVVNEDEALAVADPASALDEAVERLLLRVPAVVVTRGAAGVLVACRDGDRTQVPAVPVRRVVDTTGAGDTFCGALAAALAAGEQLLPAVRRATAAASLSVERPGAARSTPTADEVGRRLEELGAADRR